MSEATTEDRAMGSDRPGSGGHGTGEGAAAAGAAAASAPIGARALSFWHGLFAVGHRAVILLPRDMAAIIPALIVPVFFYAVTIGALQDIAGLAAIGLDYKAFQLPLALVMTVTGISRAPSLVLDIQGGYFDRLLLTPVNRWALLLGMFVADTIVLLFLSLPVLAMGLALGVRFATGIAGIIVFVAITMVWGAVVHGVPLRHRLADRQPDGSQQLLPAVLPVRVPDAGVAAPGRHDRLAGGHRHLEPGDLHPGGSADPVHRLGRVALGKTLAAWGASAPSPNTWPSPPSGIERGPEQGGRLLTLAPTHSVRASDRVRRARLEPYRDPAAPPPEAALPETSAGSPRRLLSNRREPERTLP